MNVSLYSKKPNPMFSSKSVALVYRLHPLAGEDVLCSEDAQLSPSVAVPFFDWYRDAARHLAALYLSFSILKVPDLLLLRSRQAPLRCRRCLYERAPRTALLECMRRSHFLIFWSLYRLYFAWAVYFGSQSLWFVRWKSQLRRVLVRTCCLSWSAFSTLGAVICWNSSFCF
jgi:hypothetical protein